MVFLSPPESRLREAAGTGYDLLGGIPSKSRIDIDGRLSRNLLRLDVLVDGLHKRLATFTRQS
jgi:hypothetical protein